MNVGYGWTMCTASILCMYEFRAKEVGMSGTYIHSHIHALKSILKRNWEAKAGVSSYLSTFLVIILKFTWNIYLGNETKNDKCATNTSAMWHGIQLIKTICVAPFFMLRQLNRRSAVSFTRNAFISTRNDQECLLIPLVATCFLWPNHLRNYYLQRKLCNKYEQNMYNNVDYGRLSFAVDKIPWISLSLASFSTRWRLMVSTRRTNEKILR